jgi:hypothetical protein
MTNKAIKEQLYKQYKITTDRIHSLIAKDLGVNKLYTQSNLWCEVENIDLAYTAKITISTSTFTYVLSLDGHEMLSYKFRLEINNAPEFKNITKGNIESYSTDFRGLIETTNSVLKSIMSVKKQILQELTNYQNHNYQF